MPAGTPTGLLGKNGSGKSTLLRLIAGEEAPDRGAIEAPGPVGLLHQDLPFPPATTVRCVLDDALAHARRLEGDLARAAAALAQEPGSRAAARDYDELLSRATAADVWDAPRRAEEIVAGLGLGDLPRERPLGRISGGQRERLALCHLLLTRPTTLLLDEPTNHLDDAGARFLAGLLADHPGPVLVASHDRAFLDEATRAQVDLDLAESAVGTEPGATAYTGTFTDYLLARLDARERWERRHRDELRSSRACGRSRRSPTRSGTRAAGRAPRRAAPRRSTPTATPPSSRGACATPSGAWRPSSASRSGSRPRSCTSPASPLSRRGRAGACCSRRAASPSPGASRRSRSPSRRGRSCW
ncbi:ATP-binding cassette domain-containing protein [Brachybacterium nesterenkovii]|uniref:ATP-binding cassette domain-containing protein n=1 Tax=Brachybacterium nesterenkovii TaxID=47847 RepID=UPI002E0E1DE7